MKTLIIAITILIAGCAVDHTNAAPDAMQPDGHKPDHVYIPCDPSWNTPIFYPHTCDPVCRAPIDSNQFTYCWAVVPWGDTQAMPPITAPYAQKVLAAVDPVTNTWGNCGSTSRTSSAYWFADGEQAPDVGFLACATQPPPDCMSPTDTACLGPEPTP